MKIYWIPALVLFLASCRLNDPAAQLEGSWQGVAIYNSGIEKLLQEQQFVLDTIGRETPPDQYLAQFGMQNLDSFRKAGYTALAELRKSYEAGAAASRFQFRNDGVAVFSYPDGTDSARYSLEGDSILILDERFLKGVGDDQLQMRIESMSADSLMLRIPDPSAESWIKFRKTTSKN
ncbi:MAG: hypothetical protein EOP52_12155 [Sphingobacteriales bacterium]|nr:MAG: hypothetical protein EOP52_12155 [Sphingobacteriales bacterium]